MAKKILFVALLFILIIAGSIVSMADEDNSAVLNNDNTNTNANTEASFDTGNLFDSFIGNSSTYDISAEGNEGAVNEAYSAEAVVEKYGSLFFDQEVQSEIKLVDIINIEHDGESKNVEDFVVSALVTEDVDLDYDESLILMIFIKKDDKFEPLADPEEGCAWFLTKVQFPNIGKENPNHMRFVVFPKSDYNNLQLDVNLQITDMEHIVVAPSSRWDKLKEFLLNTQQSLNLLVDNIHESE
jgi:hypothetical protein